jgi:preprotein translocase SecE subunit
VQTTLVVFAFVFIMALFLWSVDASLLWLTHRIIGTGG